MEVIYSLLALQLTFLIYQSVVVRNLKRSIRKAQGKAISVIKKNDARVHELYSLLEKKFYFRDLPTGLQGIPFADEQGIVLSVRKVEVPGIAAPYNAALIQEGDGYWLFFRFDTPLCSQDKAAYASRVGCVQLKKDFAVCEQTVSLIETGSPHSEDARVFLHGGRHYLLFNDISGVKESARTLRLAAIDMNHRRLEYATSLTINSGQVEKNWTPFSHEGELYFLYTMSPQKILKLADPKKNLLEPIASSMMPCFDWSDRWGALRGGTPAQLIDGRYLAFFHSSFEDDKGIRWYVMGAYTFEACAPFRMRQLSPYPILFKGIFEAPLLHAAHPGVRSFYPVGFVYDQHEEKIHVSCGENDSAIRIVTIDKKQLFSSLGDV